MTLKQSLLPLLGVLCLPLAARAHYLWIESDTPAEARVYFGEVAEGVREKAGGRLDERDATQARLEQGGKSDPLSLVKKDDHFLINSKDAKGWIVLEDVSSPVKDWTKSDIGIVKPMFYARAAVANKATSAKPSLTLDVIPDPAKPNEVQVFFKQQPLPKATVLVSAPNLWTKELQADESGKVTIPTPWQGRYVVEVIYKERVPGEFQGAKYEAVRHRVTLTHAY